MSSVYTPAKPPVSYLGRAEWMVDGFRGNWAESYRRLTQVHGMRHSEAVLALVEGVRLDRPIGPDPFSPDGRRGA